MTTVTKALTNTGFKLNLPKELLFELNFRHKYPLVTLTCQRSSFLYSDLHKWKKSYDMELVKKRCNWQKNITQIIIKSTLCSKCQPVKWFWTPKTLTLNLFHLSIPSQQGLCLGMQNLHIGCFTYMSIMLFKVFMLLWCTVREK